MEVERELILKIYDTVVAPEKWPDVLDRVADAVGASGCIMFSLDSDEPADPPLIATSMTSNYDTKAVSGYIKAFSQLEIADQEIFARHSAAGDEIRAIPDTVLAPTPE